jgi:DNA-directed RNA polymerase subunit L
MKNWDKDLPPLARERLAKIGELTSEEREKMVDSETVNSLLSEFYLGQIDSDNLWKKLKEEGKPSLLREAQMRLIDTLTFGSTPVELQRKRDGILAIETLKEEQNTSIVELNLNLMEELQKRHKAEIEQAYISIKAEVEGNPQLRVKQVQQGQSTMMVQLSVDEAIKQLPQWRDFTSEQEKRYSQEFAKLKEKLKRELK